MRYHMTSPSDHMTGHVTISQAKVILFDRSDFSNGLDEFFTPDILTNLLNSGTVLIVKRLHNKSGKGWVNEQGCSVDCNEPFCCNCILTEQTRLLLEIYEVTLKECSLKIQDLVETDGQYFL